MSGVRASSRAYSMQTSDSLADFWVNFKKGKGEKKFGTAHICCRVSGQHLTMGNIPLVKIHKI